MSVDDGELLGRGFCVNCRRDVDVELTVESVLDETLMSAKCRDCGELFAVALVTSEEPNAA